MLARGWLAYHVTPCAHTATAEERLYKRQRSPNWKSPKNKVSDCETAAGNCLDLDFDFLSSILL